MDTHKSSPENIDSRATMSSTNLVQFIRRMTWPDRLALFSIIAVEPFSTGCFALLAPIYPGPAAQRQLSGLEVGLVFAVYELVILVSSPVFGAYLAPSSDTPLAVGKGLFLAERTFIGGLVLAALATMAFGFVEFVAGSFLFFTASLVIRCLQALGSAAYFTASYVMVVLRYPSKVAILNGLLDGWSAIGYCLGPALGGLIYDLAPAGYRFLFPFLVMALLMLISAVLSFMALKKSTLHAHSEKLTQHHELSDNFQPPRRVYRSLVAVLLSSHTMILICLLIVGGSACWGVFEPILANHLTSVQKSFSKMEIGLVFLAGATMYALCAPVVGYIVDHHSAQLARTVMIVGLLISTTGCLLIGPVPLLKQVVPPPSLFSTTLYFVVVEMGFALGLTPTFRELLKAAEFRRNDQTTAAFVSALNAACWSLGNVLGPTVAGWFADLYGFPNTMLLTSLLLFSLVVTPAVVLSLLS